MVPSGNRETRGPPGVLRDTETMLAGASQAEEGSKAWMERDSNQAVLSMVTVPERVRDQERDTTVESRCSMVVTNFSSSVSASSARSGKVP